VWWWWGFLAFILVFLFLPLMFGWSNRGWGPPYPTYYRRRSDRRNALLREPPAASDPYTGRTYGSGDPAYGGTPLKTGLGAGSRWSWLADAFWIGLLIVIGWAIYLWVAY
jgi:hypothetical protein